MTNLADIKTRVRLLLEDSDAKRFSDSLLEAALRLALDELNQRLPLISSMEISAIDGGRDQVINGLDACLYLINITWKEAGGGSRELEPETQFVYFLNENVSTLHFTGCDFPRAGDSITVRYAAIHTISGFEGAQTTTIPESCEGALSNGTAGHACYLRAASLVEHYGSRPVESTRLVEIGRLRLDAFERTLSGLKVMQEFGFPPGFALDQWDRVRS